MPADFACRSAVNVASRIVPANSRHFFWPAAQRRWRLLPL